MKYTSGSLIASKFDQEVKPTRNNRFYLRVRMETGRNDAYRAAQTLGLEMSADELDKHTKFQSVFLLSEDKGELEAIYRGLTQGDAQEKRSVLVRGNFQEFQGRHVDEETGEISISQNLSIYTNKLQAWNRTAKTWVPLSAAFLG